ncbi:protein DETOXIFICATION 46, chloroplastic-like [Lotus japonicus]|uniref:protein DETOXIFICATION 46, chloroplastic-like n=1 Tax=Lotus japonicus TaxID=34305 RepID=UPI00258B10A8|nr:protein DETOXIFICATION 46, chloroplastic-like [Lotus japonicus]
MALKLHPSVTPLSLHTFPRQNPNLTPPRSLSVTVSNRHLRLLFRAHSLSANPRLTLFHRTRFRTTARAIRGQELTGDGLQQSSTEEEHHGQITEDEEEEGGKKELTKQDMWSQMKEIAIFTGPAVGLWICGPLMSLIDTAVIGQGSSIELAALGPATVVCDNLSYVFMFLSVATSNMVATALAKQDREEVQHHISVLLFIGLACGFMMLLFTGLFGAATLTAFTGPKNVHVVPAANTYVQIRGLAWPALLVGWVAQSASLGMKDSWGPLKALAAASVINGIGDIVLCIYLGYGIAGAAWATMASQVVAAYMMMQALNKKGYNAFAFSIPSGKELLMIFRLAAPVFMTMMSKVAFYSLLVYFATSMGTHTMAAHQVMVQTFCMCTVWGEPLSQTAQSFMPELIYGVNRSLSKARMLLRSLVIIGATLGLLLGIVGTSVPWLFPYVFTPDQMVIQEMHKVLIPYFIALAVTPPTHSLEGTLLAGRDLRYISLSMGGCFCVGVLVLLFLSSRYGLQGCWFALALFQWARFSLALQRLLSPTGILYAEDINQNELQKLKTA